MLYSYIINISHLSIITSKINDWVLKSIIIPQSSGKRSSFVMSTPSLSRLKNGGILTQYFVSNIFGSIKTIITKLLLRVSIVQTMETPVKNAIGLYMCRCQFEFYLEITYFKCVDYTYHHMHQPKCEVRTL